MAPSEQASPSIVRVIGSRPPRHILNHYNKYKTWCIIYLIILLTDVNRAALERRGNFRGRPEGNEVADGTGHRTIIASL